MDKMIINMSMLLYVCAYRAYNIVFFHVYS